MSRNEVADAYKLLESDFNDTLEDIKKRYRRLALKHHPDRGGNIEEIKALNKAFQTISKRVKHLENKSDYFARNEKAINQMVHDIIFGTDLEDDE
jgi:curved DNA-binding protein CbpA